MEKQLHINLKYDSFERLFLISYDPKKHTFKWLAKAVFQRYTIFIPDVDKPPPPHLKLHIGDSKEVSICSNTFSPPIEALICDYVDEKDVVVCQFTNYDFHSNCIRIKFFLKYTGPSCERSYVDITAQQQEELLMEFKKKRFHNFQSENQKKLLKYINKQTNLQEGICNGKDVDSEGSPCSSGKVLLPHPPSYDNYMSKIAVQRLRHRLGEKTARKLKNLPVYDYNPEDGENSDENEFEMKPMEEQLDDGLQRRPEFSMMSSREINKHLRRLSFQRNTKSISGKVATGVRGTVLAAFSEKAKKVQQRDTFAIGKSSIENKPQQHELDGKFKNIVKPNGPKSKDDVWRKRCLQGAGIDNVS